MRIDRVFGGPAEPAFSQVVDEYRIRGFRLDDCALVHRPSQTLLVADLVHNVGRPRGAWSALYTRVMGFYDRVAISRAIRWTAFADRLAARGSIDELLAAPFDRIIVGHGTPVRSDGKASLAAAYKCYEPADCARDHAAEYQPLGGLWRTFMRRLPPTAVKPAGVRAERDFPGAAEKDLKD